jgi:hypothetical protein
MIEHKVLEELHRFVFNEDDTARINAIHDNMDSDSDMFDVFVQDLDTAILDVWWSGSGELLITIDPNTRNMDDLVIVTNIRKYIEGEAK